MVDVVGGSVVVVVVVVVVGGSVVVVVVVVVVVEVVVVVVLGSVVVVVVVVGVAVADEDVVVDGRVAMVVVAAVSIGSLATLQLMGMFCARHRPVRGVFNALVVASMHALARPFGYSLVIFRDPLLQRWLSASDIIRVCMFTHSDGA